MATIINRSRYTVSVKRRPELNHSFPYSRQDAAEAYRDQLLTEMASCRVEDWSGTRRFTEYVPSNVFTSPLEFAVRGLRLERATASQWRSTLTNLPGIRRDELTWSGLIEYLTDDRESIERTQILAWLRCSRTRLVLGYETEIAFDHCCVMT